MFFLHVGERAAAVHCDMQVGGTLTKLVISNAAVGGDRHSERQPKLNCNSDAGCCVAFIHYPEERQVPTENHSDRWTTVEWVRV